MQLKVVRSVFTDVATLGQMFINGTFFAYTLEGTNRNMNGDCTKKVQNQTCIDPGNYDVEVNYSEHFEKDLPQILNVPCFSGIRIHGGNGPADTDGCILIGAQSNMQDRIWDCPGVVADITAQIQALDPAVEQVTIEIINNAANA